MITDTEVGSYLLGVIHGDGNISERSVSIIVSGKTPDYVDVIADLWKDYGCSPKTYLSKRNVYRVDVHSRALADELRMFKRVDTWMFPSMPVSFPDYISGLIDTDGYISGQGRYRVNITQKAGDKLPRIRPILDGIGFSHIPIKRDENRKIRGEVYPVDLVWWNTPDDVIALHSILRLRHSAKKKRLDECIKTIGVVREQNKSFHILRFLRGNEGATIPQICNSLGLEREAVLRTLNYLRRQSRVTRQDPPIDTLIWNWVDTNRFKGE